MRKADAVKRIIVLQLIAIEFAVLVVGYALFWLKKYKPFITVQFWQKGDALVIAIYAVILLMFFLAYGAGKIGYLRSFEIFLSQAISILVTNVIAFAQLPLMNGGLVKSKYILLLTLMQLGFALFWSFFANFIYRTVFAPRDLLMVYGDRPIDDIV